MTVHSLKDVVRPSSAPTLSPARQMLADATAAVQALSSEITEREARVIAARQADSDVATARRAIVEYRIAVDCAEIDESPATLSDLQARLREARGRQADVAKEEAELIALQPRHAEAQERRKQALRLAIAEEGRKLADFHMAHALAAVHAKAAVEALANWATYTTDDRTLGVMLSQSLNAHPLSTDADPGALDRSIRNLEASLKAYGDRWAALPAMLERGQFDVQIEYPAVGGGSPEKAA